MKLIFEELKMSTKHIIWFSCYINDKTKIGAFPVDISMLLLTPRLLLQVAGPGVPGPQ